MGDKYLQGNLVIQSDDGATNVKYTNEAIVITKGTEEINLTYPEQSGVLASETYINQHTLPAPEEIASFDRIARIKRDTVNECDYLTVTPGSGANTVPMRDPDGSLRAKYNKEGQYTTDDTLINQLGLNNALSLISQAVIHGFDIPREQQLQDAILMEDYGLYFIKGDNITVTYTANESAQTFNGDFHFIIKYNNGVNKIIHIYPKSVNIVVATVPSVTSFDGTLSTNIAVNNGSTQYGCRMVKIPMKSI